MRKPAHTYFTGKPCHLGHVAPRYAGNHGCVECAALASIKCYEANKEKHADRGKKWWAANPGKGASYIAGWRERNPEKNKEVYKSQNNKRRLSGESAKAGAAWRAKNPQMVKELASRWQKANPGKVAAASAKRIAMKLQATPGWTNHIAVGEFYSLAAIKTRLTAKSWHVDHIVPLKSNLVCGLHTHYNLQVIPGIDNIRKGNRHWPDMP